MSTKFFTLLTQLGADKLANAVALGTKIEITHMAVGDGGGSLPTPDTRQTKLINEKRRAAINTLSIDPKNTNQIIAEQVIPESEGGWWIREIGLYDKDGVLIAVGNCAETYKPQLQEGSGRTQTIRMILIVSSADAVTLKVDPSVVLATREYVDDSIQKHANSRNHPDATLKEKGLVVLSSALDSNSETHAATPKAVKATYDLARAADNNANGRLEKSKNGADLPNKDEFVKNLGLTKTKELAENAFSRSGGHVTGDITITTDTEIAWRRNTDMAAIGFKNTGDGDADSYMWFKTGDNGNEYFKWDHVLSGGVTSEWMSLKSDNLRIKGHPVYHQGNKPTAEEIQVEPRFNTTIDLTGLSSDRYYPVWWRFPTNYNGANSWITIHRNYAENRDNKNPFGKETHLAGLEVQIEGSDTLWGGDSHYLNIKRIYQRYRTTVKKIQHGMMSIARPVNGKYPLYYGWKSGQIVDCYTHSGCYLRGGLTYHATSNFSGIKYSRKDEEVEISSSTSDQSTQEIKWTVKSYNESELGKDYENMVIPYEHDLIELIKKHR
ncbi:phage tail protein [Xenorhabdus szentirmaii]|uniref:phage tail protein n=1 Tax=Xenorhabdus szentirmaii TaxID=290112 RepID=UPI0019A4D6A9|nr:phage tail protein [Xenorhabdus sp. ZM]MBD2806342.1 phage tail protein [Xenorhabdus sp. ZM]